MAIPVFVVTGFLDSGKTTFLNHMLNSKDARNVRLLVIQFESGEEEFHSKYQNCRCLCFVKKDLEQRSQQIVCRISDAIQSREFDEIWIEWNGVVPFSNLQSLFLCIPLCHLCEIQSVLHVADASNIENLIGRTGGALPEQIANSDFAVVHSAGSVSVFRRVRRLMHGINPGVSTYDEKALKKIDKHLFVEKEHPVKIFFLTLVIMIALYFAYMPLLEALHIPVNTIINVFSGILLQAVPFLMIGVLLSSAIQILIPRSVIERRFPKSVGMGMLVAIIGGFCLPVCDCASIPIFRSLVKKGIPIPAAVTFMTATPIINPVVILSTYYAFGGSLTIVAERVCLGIAASVIIGLIFALHPPKGRVLSGGALDGLMCSCGCYSGAESITDFKDKVDLFLRHSQAEFFSVGKYLVIGAFISSIFQAMGTEMITSAQSGAGLMISIVVMMTVAFLLSLCSSSDAVIARSFAGQFPMGAIMGFLIFGPMMDIKNVMMLSAGFSKRFIGRLILTSFIVCFVVVFLFSRLGGM